MNEYDFSIVPIKVRVNLLYRGRKKAHCCITHCLLMWFDLVVFSFLCGVSRQINKIKKIMAASKFSSLNSLDGPLLLPYSFSNCPCQNYGFPNASQSRLHIVLYSICRTPLYWNPLNRLTLWIKTWEFDFIHNTSNKRKSAALPADGNSLMLENGDTPISSVWGYPMS